LNSDFVDPHIGQTQSSVISSKLVPGAIPPSASPMLANINVTSTLNEF